MALAHRDPTPAPMLPACVSRIRIHGFKTFADPVALDILTGFVGPNGCVKNNVVDALRWAMGEGNARTLSGAEMEDVIFTGTVPWPDLHQAEVVLMLDGGSVPAGHDDEVSSREAGRRAPSTRSGRRPPSYPGLKATNSEPDKSQSSYEGQRQPSASTKLRAINP